MTLTNLVSFGRCIFCRILFALFMMIFFQDSHNLILVFLCSFIATSYFHCANSTTNMWSSPNVSHSVVIGYFILESSFYLWFHYRLLPWTNRQMPTQEYRGYGRNRHKLFVRILKRLERTFRWTHDEHSIQHISASSHKHFLFEFHSFLCQFFLHKTPGTGPKKFISTFAYNKKNPSTEKILKKGDFDELAAWAFFGKSYQDLKNDNSWEIEEHKKLFEHLEEQYGIAFQPGQTPSDYLKPCLLSLDPVTPSYKPLFVYMFTILLNFISGITLRLNGFRFHKTDSGIGYWIRNSDTNSTSAQDHDGTPFLFFHGISPGGYALYLPMLFFGILSKNRPILLIENPSITCTLNFFDVPTEQDTVNGIKQAIHTHFGSETKVTLCGHSFGSCQMTWLVHAIPDRIHRFILIDPVTILLSNGETMVNFLYKRFCTLNNYSFHDNETEREIDGDCDEVAKVSPLSCSSSIATSSSKLSNRSNEELLGHSEHDRRSRRNHSSIMQSSASTEIGIEYYLRRHFSWYNSELWLEDIPKHIQIIIFLSGKDEIINPFKVKREIEIQNKIRNSYFYSPFEVNENESESSSLIELVYWNSDGHGTCVYSPRNWKEIKNYTCSLR